MGIAFPMLKDLRSPPLRSVPLVKKQDQLCSAREPIGVDGFLQ